MRTPRCDLPRLCGSFLWSVPSGTLTRKLGYARTYGRERKDPQAPTPAERRPPRAGRDGNVQRGRGRVRPLRPDAICEPASAAHPRHPWGRRVASRRKHPRAAHRVRRPGATLKQGSLELGEVVFLPGGGESPTLADRERQAILDTLEVTHGKLAETARRLGISRTTLWRRLRAYGLRPNGHASAGPASRM